MRERMQGGERKGRRALEATTDREPRETYGRAGRGRLDPETRALIREEIRRYLEEQETD